AEANRVAALATLAAAALVLWGSFAALANVAEILRVRRWQAAVLAAALALLAGEWRPRRARARPVLVGVLLVIGAAGFTLPVVVVGTTAGAAPWRAWSEAASRPAFTFDERSAWAARALLFVVVLAAVAWGVYAARAAPDLALGAPGRAGLFELPARVVPAPAGPALATLAVLGLLLLFLAGAFALRALVASLASGSSEQGVSLVWAGPLLAAGAAGVRSGYGWSEC